MLFEIKEICIFYQKMNKPDTSSDCLMSALNSMFLHFIHSNGCTSISGTSTHSNATQMASIISSLLAPFRKADLVCDLIQ